MTKRLSLLLLLLFMLNLLLSPLFALEVTIGAGDESAPYPLDFSLGSSLYQTLYYPDELGFSSGTITALEFYNNFTQSLNGRRMQIWLGTTDQADLSGGFIPANHLTMVFDSRVSFPAGENAISITLDTPYIHTPGNLVMMVLRPHDFDTSYNNLFKCQTIGNNRACFCADYNYTVNAYNPPAGMVMGQFPKTKITYTPLTIVNDLGAVSISGNHYPNVGSSSNYTVSVKNNGTASQTNYQVKLMYGSTELASVAGPAINSLETAQVTIPWTPATADTMSIYGKVVLAGDEIATNDETLLLKLLVQPEGTLSITIGEGNETANIPMDFRYYNAIYQCLYYPDELGIVNGTITDIAFYNNFLSEIPEAATKIWLGNTTAQDLSDGWIPSTEMRLVYDGDVDYLSGQNIIAISLQRVFNYDSSNLVMMVQRPVELSWYSHMDLFKCQTRGSTRALRVASDNVLLDPIDPGNTTVFVQISGQFPQTTFFCTGQPIERDLSVHSLTGNVTPAVGTAESYIVTVKNNGTVIESNYQVKLMAGDVELASVNGPAIQGGQSLEISLPWTPTAAGPMAICGKVVMTGDQIEVNNRTVPLNIAVQAADVVAVTVGEGDSAHRVPFDFTWGTSLFETIFQASELNIGGEIRGIKFYNRFTHEVGSKPIKIWLGETTQTDLSGGYIPASEMELVFDGNIAFPCGSNDIYIPIDPPWIYGGGNLVMMTNR